jgi:hypothetical protein
MGQANWPAPIMWREPSVPYTPEEDRIIIKCVEEAIAENRFLVEGFDKAAKLIRSKIGNKRSTVTALKTDGTTLSGSP